MKRITLVIWVMGSAERAADLFRFWYYSESTCELKLVQKIYLHKNSGSYFGV